MSIQNPKYKIEFQFGFTLFDWKKRFLNNPKKKKGNMKKLLPLIFLLSTAFAQQKDTINNATITVGAVTYNNVTIIIPKQSNPNAASQKYVDSSVSNKALQSFVNNAVNNLQNSKQGLLTAGQNISIVNNVISATSGGSGFPDTLNLGEQKQLMFVKPFNYGVTYPNGRQQGGWGMLGYATHNGVNPDGIPDQVWQDPASYNSYPNGARINNKDISTSSRTELYYYIPGIGYSVERHLFEFTDMKGGVHRTLSYYGARDGSMGFWNMEGDYVAFLNSKQKQYASVQDGYMSVQATQAGRITGFQGMTFGLRKIGIYDIGEISFLQVPGVIEADGYGKFIAALPVFIDNAAAKAANKPINQWYKDPNGFVRIVQ